MKKNIVIVAGGDSSEYEVSLKSAEGLCSFMDKGKYNIYVAVVRKGDWHVRVGEEKFPIDKNDFSFAYKGEQTKFDFAYVTIHGTPGENGRLEGYFDLLDLPYSCCGVLASSLTFNKYVCKQYLSTAGVKIADSIRLLAGESLADEEVVEKLGLPVFIKPNDGGSSCGVSKVKAKEQIQPAIQKAFDEGEEVIIEGFLSGIELTCGCYKIKGKTVVFPVTEVVSKDEFFDYDAKYNGRVDEITPARITAELSERVKSETSGIYDYLGARGIIRVDYIVSPEGEIKLLEVNTTPGMTATSFIPQQVKAAGLDIKEVLSEIIDNELEKLN